MRSLRTILATFGLALAVLITQHGVQTHWLTHFVAEHSQPEKHSSHDAPCELCAAYASDAAALPGKMPTRATVPPQRDEQPPSPTGRTLATRYYSSRAPPILPL